MAADLQPILQANPQSHEAKELLPSPKNQDQDLPEQVAFQAPLTMAFTTSQHFTTIIRFQAQLWDVVGCYGML